MRGRISAKFKSWERRIGECHGDRVNKRPSYQSPSLGETGYLHPYYNRRISQGKQKGTLANCLNKNLKK